jgi:hypothetical protein
MKDEDKRLEEVKARVNVSKVLKKKEMGVKDQATVVPARVTKAVPKQILDYLGVNSEELDLIWVKMIDDKTGERIVVLLKDTGKTKK